MWFCFLLLLLLSLVLLVLLLSTDCIVCSISVYQSHTSSLEQMHGLWHILGEGYLTEVSFIARNRLSHWFLRKLKKTSVAVCWIGYGIKTFHFAIRFSFFQTELPPRYFRNLISSVNLLNLLSDNDSMSHAYLSLFFHQTCNLILCIFWHKFVYSPLATVCYYLAESCFSNTLITCVRSPVLFILLLI